MFGISVANCLLVMNNGYKRVITKIKNIKQ